MVVGPRARHILFVFGIETTGLHTACLPGGRVVGWTRDRAMVDRDLLPRIEEIRPVDLSLDYPGRGRGGDFRT